MILSPFPNLPRTSPNQALLLLPNTTHGVINNPNCAARAKEGILTKERPWSENL